MLDLQYIDKKFERVYDKLDEISAKQTAFELAVTKKVQRNALILNGMLWFIGVVSAACVGVLIRSLFVAASAP